MTVKVNWCSDYYYPCDLKKIVDIPDNIEEEDIANYISDEYGYDVQSFEILE